MLFKVTKQYGRGAETIAESFSDLAKARAFMQHEAKKDAQMKIQTLYRIYEFDEVVEELDTAKMDTTPQQSEQNSDSSAGKGAGFRPTPLGTSPKPKGSVHQKPDDEEEKK
jgi:hypothetical protein